MIIATIANESFVLATFSYVDVDSFSTWTWCLRKSGTGRCFSSWALFRINAYKSDLDFSETQFQYPIEVL